MKRLLAIGLLISSLSFSFYQYNDKVGVRLESSQSLLIK